MQILIVKSLINFKNKITNKGTNTNLYYFESIRYLYMILKVLIPVVFKLWFIRQ